VRHSRRALLVDEEEMEWRFLMAKAGKKRVRLKRDVE
jgi:hypothetical protein